MIKTKVHWASWSFASFFILSGLGLWHVASKFGNIYRELLEPDRLTPPPVLTAIAMSHLSWVIPLLLGLLALLRDFHPGMRKWLPWWLLLIIFAVFAGLLILGLFIPLEIIVEKVGH